MPEQVLDGPQVRSAFKHRRCEAVSKHVRMHAAEPCLDAQFEKDPLDRAGCDGRVRFGSTHQLTAKEDIERLARGRP
jgi:hypothetical protein